MSTDLQVVEPIDAEVLADLTVRREPSIVLEEARKAAVCLKDVLDKKPKKFMIGKEQYLEFEDWQTVGKFYGVTCGTDHDPNPENRPTVDFVRLGEIEGFKATCVALHNGKIISRAAAFCLRDEEKWGERNKYEWVYCLKSGGTSVENPPKHEIIWVPNPNQEGKFLPKKEHVLLGKETVPLFQLASMAQTRANAKVLRNVLSWVVVLAGYKPTPAEEMTNGKQVEQIQMAALVDGLGTVFPADGNLQSQDAAEQPPADTTLAEYLDKFDLVESVKAWSELKNASLAQPWLEEESRILNDRSALALKRLKDAEKGKKK